MEIKYNAKPFYVIMGGKEKDEFEEALWSYYSPNTPLPEIDITINTDDNSGRNLESIENLYFDITEIEIGPNFWDAVQGVIFEWPYIFVTVRSGNYELKMRYIDICAYKISVEPKDEEQRAMILFKNYFMQVQEEYETLEETPRIILKSQLEKTRKNIEYLLQNC